MGIYHYRRERK